MQQDVKNTVNAMQPPRSVEEVKAELESTEKGGVRQSIRNCLTVFQRDPVLAGAIAYNSLTDRKDIIKPIGYHRTGTALTDTDMKYLLLYLEENYGLTSEKKIENAIGIVANENKYHPIRDCLNNLEWDGTERIRYALHHFLGAEVSEYSYEALKLFMLGAITRAFKPGSKFEIMLCLVGGQGAGKSTFFRLLALRDEWFSDDLRKLDDDNVYRKLQGHWIIEMSEMMATANAKSIEEIKSFLSRQKEVYKIPYETHPADRPRQCVFGGTSNALDFLPLDRSGNRRFIPVMVYPEQSEVHILEDEAASRAYIRQMWAEAMEIYRSGNFKLKFSPENSRIGAITECGGYGLDLSGKGGSFSYRKAKDKAGLEKLLTKLYRSELLPLKSQGLDCCIYTQLSDVEQERNGLLTADRETVKIDTAQMRKLNQAWLEDSPQ